MTEVPALKRQQFYIYRGSQDPADVADEPEGYMATVIWGDQLRGELEGKNRGIDMRRQPMMMATLWCWAEAVRAGRTTEKFDQWRAGVVDIVEVKDGDLSDDTDDAGPDPT